jgi:hypothetical protein
MEGPSSFQIKHACTNVHFDHILNYTHFVISSECIFSQHKSEKNKSTEIELKMKDGCRGSTPDFNNILSLPYT